MAPNESIINPNERLAIPKWISADYFKDILKTDEPDCVGVKKFTPVAAIPPGENFTSVMLRIHMDLEMADGSVKTKKYIMKTMLDEDKGGAIINQMPLFPKELEMYGKYLPAFEKLYEEAGEKIQLSPKCLKTELKDGRINFVFEDLSAKNFKNADRLKGLSMDEMRESLRRLAEVHAASVVYAEKNGPYPTMYDTGFFNKETSMSFLEEAYKLREKHFKQLLADWNLPESPKYIKSFPTLEQFFESGVQSLDTQKNNFNVLCHGDFWSSNIMFNYKEDGAVDQALILDYQAINWGSVAQDLIFFITLSPAKEIRVKKFDEFIVIYHERLVECLTLLKYEKPMPKLRDIHKDLHNDTATFYGFFAIFNHLSLICYPSDPDSSIHVLTQMTEEGEQLRKRIYANPKYSELMQELYPFYLHRGIFNFTDYDN